MKSKTKKSETRIAAQEIREWVLALPSLEDAIEALKEEIDSFPDVDEWMPAADVRHIHCLEKAIELLEASREDRSNIGKLTT